MSTLLRLVTAGSVDDGKSTLIGRLLYDSHGVFEDQWASVQNISKKCGYDYTALALLTDGLRSEREQGITIDVAYRYFATAKRKFIIADTPGHKEYTRNMVTGASSAQLAIVLVDVRNGLLEQSRRHAFLSSLLGIQHLVLAVNKMDLVDWDRQRFEQVRDEFYTFATRLNVHDVTVIPVSALLGDNVVTKSDKMPWYEGPPLLTYLEDVYVASDRNLVDLRFPVQYVIRAHTAEHHDHRSYAGTMAGGVLRPGDDIIALPSGITSRITSIQGPGGQVSEAFPPMAVSITLNDYIDLSRGDMIARKSNQPCRAQNLDAMVCWMTDRPPLRAGTEYIIKHTTRTTRARVARLHYRLDVNTLHGDRTASSLQLNDIGRITLRTQTPLLIDEYRRNTTTGSFILVDTVTNNTVAAGMVIHRNRGDRWVVEAIPPANPNTIHRKSLTVTNDRLIQGEGSTIWFTGLSGSGKSTVAFLVERKLLQAGRPAYVLDGDNLRHGLNADLGFSMADRTENVRRLAHIAALFVEAGLVVLVTAISPLREQRKLARRIHSQAGLPFHEVYVATPIDICEKRDPKGLYVKARAGEIPDFTGIDSPYEEPENPDLRLIPDDDVDTMAMQVLELLKQE
jgi:bifunctional enzyme CysN/CysC